MAASARASAVAGEMTAEEQAQLDQMRADDAQPIEEIVASPPETASEADAAQEAQQEGADGGEGEAPAADGRPRMVPHAAMHEERIRRQSVEQQLAEERKARQTLEERTNLILQRFAAPQQPAQQQEQPPAIDPQQDPVGHFMAVQQRQGAVLADVVQALTNLGQQNQQASAASQISQRAIAMEQQFAAQTPDYNQAVVYLANQRHQELEAAGWGDQAERQAMISREAMQLAAQAMQQNRNPAEVVYQLSKIRGFQAPASSAAATQEAPAQNATQRLDNVARGQQQSSRSLGNVRGSGPAPITANTLLQMSDKDFAKMIETKEGRELLGS